MLYLNNVSVVDSLNREIRLLKWRISQTRREIRKAQGELQESCRMLKEVLMSYYFALKTKAISK